MKFYTVHEPPDAPADRIDRADKLKFVHDGFTPAAVAFGPLWLLANRLWLAFLVYAGVASVVLFAVLTMELSPRWFTLMLGAMNLILGFEGASLQRLALARDGWQQVGQVSGRTLDECERRFFEGFMAEPRMSRQDEFVSTVNALRGPAGGGLAAMATGAVTGEGRISRAPGGGASRGRWLPWRRG